MDLTPIVDVLPALREEWAGLQFDGSGTLVSPLSGDAVPALRLVAGRHRQPGATYRITVTSPKLELSEARRREFDDEAQKLTRDRATSEQWRSHAARRREASVQVGTRQEHFEATLHDDNQRRLKFSVSDEPATWTLDVEIEHGRWPKVDLNGRIDLSAVLRADGTPGCLAGFLGGTGRGSAVLELAALERGGQAIRAEGRANRFRGSAKANIRASATKWILDGTGSLRARGLGRLVLAFAGRRVRDGINGSIDEFWTKARTNEWEQHLSQLRDQVDATGGPGPFVRRAIWDRDFNQGFGAIDGAAN